MPFSKEDWLRITSDLQSVAGLVDKFQQTKDRRCLEDAILLLWRFAEYAMNAGLELKERRPDRGHDMLKTAELLRAEGLLEADFGKVLGQLEKYRRKVDYLGYSREKSVHFNRQNVLDCLRMVEELQTELEPHLIKAGKL